MAGKPAAPAAPKYSSIEIIFYIIVFLSVAGSVGNWINKNQSLITSYYNNFLFNLVNIFAKYVVFSVFFSIALLIFVIIYVKKESEMRQKIMSKVLPPAVESIQNSTESVILNPKWKLVEEHINSEDPNKWKLAILEADIILSELLDSISLPGDSVGEKLKNVEPSDFDHIEEAWEAHKIRNAIAHQGSDFLLTQREARRVIALYKSVFSEFKII